MWSVEVAKSKTLKFAILAAPKVCAAKVLGLEKWA